MADKIRSEERAKRIRAALRDNLKRRKAASRSAKAQTESPKKVP